MASRLLCIVLLFAAAIPGYAGPVMDRLRQIFVSMPDPQYPYGSRHFSLHGHGLFRLRLDTQGKVTAVQIIRSTGSAELDTAATDALKQWRAKRGAPPEVDVPITFCTWAGD